MAKLLRILGLTLLLSARVNATELSPSINSLAQFNPLTVATGTFVQNKFFTVLKNPISSTGNIYFDQKLGFIWETTQPIYSAMILKQDGLYSVDHLQQVKRIKNAGSIAAILMNAISGDVATLSKEFTLSENNKNQCVQLTPKNEVIAKVMRVIELCGSGTVEHLVLFETSGNRTEIDVTLSAINQLPEAARAQLQ